MSDPAIANQGHPYALTTPKNPRTKGHHHRDPDPRPTGLRLRVHPQLSPTQGPATHHALQTDPRLQRIADDPKLYLWAAQGIIDFEHLLTRHAEFDAWIDAHPNANPASGTAPATRSTSIAAPPNSPAT